MFRMNKLSKSKDNPCFWLPAGVHWYANGVLSKSLISQTTPMQKIPVRQVASDVAELMNFTARRCLFIAKIHFCVLDFFYSPSLLRLSVVAVIRSFLCNINIVRMTFFKSCTGNSDKFSVFLKKRNCLCTAISHTCTKTAEKLEHCI